MNTASILIVEDEPILALELKEDLEARGYTIAGIISDGDMVMQAVLQQKPDIIIMDIKLFGFRDGIEAVDRVRGFFKTPILYLSSYPYSEVRARLAKSQPAWYLEKPYIMEKLMLSLEEITATLGDPI